MFFRFANLSNVWLNRKQLDPHLLLHSVYCKITRPGVSGKPHYTYEKKEAKGCFCIIMRTNFDVTDPLEVSEGPSGQNCYFL